MNRKTDVEIRQAVEHELREDRRVSQPGLNVIVDEGIVTLTGEVSSWGKRQAAQEAAHRVGGVLDVANEIRVKPPNSARKSDTEIARAVRERLEWDVFIPDDQIRTTVSEGRITLEGRVSLHRERDDAEKAVRDLAGVTGVINRIEVVPPPVVAEDLRKAIQAALQRQTEREPKGIDLDVEDGRVSLRGVVRSWREREAVLGAVKGTAGVRTIDHTIRVDPYAV
jgi:osmotically-inducible protein OsmY